jgi:hypothetical protein
MTTLPARLDNLSRRSLLALAGLGVGSLLAPSAFASPVLAFPLRAAYAHIGKTGFMRLTSDDQQIWAGLQTRLGGLIDDLTPIQPSDMMGAKTPELDGGASCAMVARQIALNAGLSHVILYATDDGRRPEKSEHRWLTKAFHVVRQEYYEYDDATAEAHLLTVDGGPAIASVSVDARKLNWLEVIGGRNPDRENLLGLTQALERRFQAMARSQYENQRSIAD